MSHSMFGDRRHSLDGESGGGEGSRAAQSAVALTEKAVGLRVAEAGIRGAAAAALASQAGSSLQNLQTRNDYFNRVGNSIIEDHADDFIGLTLREVTDAFRMGAPTDFDRSASVIERAGSRDALELILCFKHSLALSGAEGLFSNFGVVTKIHDLEARAAALLRVVAPSFRMTPAVCDDAAGLMLQEGKRTGFYRLSSMLRSADDVLHMAEAPNTAMFGSLVACNQRGLLLAILSHAAEIPELLNPRQREARLRPCDSSWSRSATRQVAELYNALDEKWRPVFGDGIHQEALGA